MERLACNAHLTLAIAALACVGAATGCRGAHFASGDTVSANADPTAPPDPSSVTPSSPTDTGDGEGVNACIHSCRDMLGSDVDQFADASDAEMAQLRQCLDECMSDTDESTPPLTDPGPGPTPDPEPPQPPHASESCDFQRNALLWRAEAQCDGQVDGVLCQCTTIALFIYSTSTCFASGATCSDLREGPHCCRDLR